VLYCQKYTLTDCFFGDCVGEYQGAKKEYVQIREIFYYKAKNIPTKRNAK